jgi:hypothetical protein
MSASDNNRMREDLQQMARRIIEENGALRRFIRSLERRAESFPEIKKTKK